MLHIGPPITGETLKRRLGEKIIHEPIADGFLYKGASLMLSSPPGVGKSYVTIDSVARLACGMPLFGVFEVKKPCRVWYIQMERPDIESLERLQQLSAHIPIEHPNIFIDVELQALNFLKEAHLDIVVKRGHEIKPDVIVIDPLYGIAVGLSGDEVGSTIAKIFTVLKKELGCALWINHHTVKNTYDIINGQKVPKDDPFYGAQWLKAHVTGSYIISRSEAGTHWECKKDSHLNLTKVIDLQYDQETGISTVQTDSMFVSDKIRMFINSRLRTTNNKFTFNELVVATGCAVRTVRTCLGTPNFSAVLNKHKNNGYSTIYEIIHPV